MPPPDREVSRFSDRITRVPQPLAASRQPA
jgi:hypothetical protein